MAAEPTEREVEEWAAREKRRREAWLAGPSEAEKRNWSRRQRHLGELRDLYGPSDGPDVETERQLARRLRLDAHLARVGMLDLLAYWPRRLGAIGACSPTLGARLGAKLIRSGLDVEYDYYGNAAFGRELPPDFSPDD